MFTDLLPQSRVKIASHACLFRGARISSLGRGETRAPPKTPACEASVKTADNYCKSYLFTTA